MNFSIIWVRNKHFNKLICYSDSKINSRSPVRINQVIEKNRNNTINQKNRNSLIINIKLYFDENSSTHFNDLPVNCKGLF